MAQNQSVIIVAGGKGERMQSEIPKQFLKIHSKPVLMHTIEVFHTFNPEIQIIVVLPESQLPVWDEMCTNHNFKISHQITTGGSTRFNSVVNGLALVEKGNLVAVHDGVRPLVSLETLQHCFETAFDKGTAIPVYEMTESVRELSEKGSRAVDRNLYKLVQTPQVFSYEIIEKAYKQEYSPLFTDDASVVEAAGFYVNLVEGNRENIKITTPFDLKIAQLFL